jgi:hypothetical protein
MLNRPATRLLRAGDPVYWRDFAPVTELTALPGQRLYGISLRGLSIMPQFIRVGAQVDFVVGRRREDDFALSLPIPLPASDGLEPSPIGLTAPPRLKKASAASDGKRNPVTDIELIGPFHVAAVGQRVTRGGEIDEDADADDGVLTIAVRFENGHPLDEDTRRLLAARAGIADEQIIGIVLRSNDQERSIAGGTPKPADK